MRIIGQGPIEKQQLSKDDAYVFPRYHSGSIAGQLNAAGFWKGLEAAETVLSQVFEDRPEIADEVAEHLGKITLAGEHL